MHKDGYALATFFSIWFLFYCSIRIVGTFGQLYVFANLELGKTMALFGATSIILSSLLGFLVLRESLSIGAYAGISLAIIAFLTLAITR
jgi:drug/metabolite transporter (DMT)-like permease